MYKIEDFVENTVVELTEEEAVNKYGSVHFNEMLAGLDANYEVVDLSAFNDDMDESMDGDFDSAMASAGFGTDEDYGYFGDDFY